MVHNFRSWVLFLVPFLLLLGISGYAVVTPYFEFWFVPNDFWPTQMLAAVIAIAVYTAAFLRHKFMNAPSKHSSKVSVYAASLVFLATLAAGVVSRLYLIDKFRPSFAQIDVPYVTEAAVGALLQFRNPYNELLLSHIVYIYGYPPFSLLYYTPFVVIGDLRYGNVVADALTATGIFLIGLREHRPVLGAMVASLFSLSSLSMVTTYYGNNHMITASFLVLTMLALVYKRFGVAGCLLALATLTTQFGALAVPFVLYYAYKTEKLRRVLLAATATALCILLPFSGTAKGLAYGLFAPYFIFGHASLILGQQAAEFKILGFPLTRLIGILLIGALMIYPYVAKNLKKASGLHVVCAGVIVSTLILSVLIAPVFFEAYLIPSIALILVYSVL